MLYASTRNSLMKALGSAAFVDSIFATSKDDLTPEAYAAHKRHITAPKPLSSREQELADVRAAENNSLSHQGTTARTSHVNDSIGFPWSDEAETAIVNFSRADACAVVILVSKKPGYVAASCAEALNSKSTQQRKR
jgi:twinfilin-like protein